MTMMTLITTANDKSNDYFNENIITTMTMIFKGSYQVTARNLEKKEAVVVYIVTSLDKFYLTFFIIAYAC